jgi:PAS domain S-box-containing protein
MEVLLPVPSDRNLNRDELGTLYAIARDLNSTLDLDKVLQLVMDRLIEFVEADRGFLMLVNRETDELEFKIACNARAQTIAKKEFEISLSTVKQVVNTRRALTDADLFDPTLSMREYDIHSIMCAPLIVRDRCIGAVYVDRRSTMNLFNPKQRDLLLAFCHQAAIAIDNAQLFALVDADKQYMDNIFASVANGVITIDSAGIIRMFNFAAGNILNMNPLSAIGKHYQKVFSALPQIGLIELLQNAHLEHEHGTIVPNSVVCEIPGRPGKIYLNLAVSSLRDEQGRHIGMTLVIDDRTEQKRKEAEAKEIRRLFERYVNPNVVEQLTKNPQALHLGGETTEITVVFADIRGYTRLSENMAPQEVMNLLNSYLNLMVEEIWKENGMVTAFMGDSLMAIFNVPLPQRAHALKAVRATWSMRSAVLTYQRAHPRETPISFGFGINTGLAVIGNIGSEERIQNYTAIGDTINVADRLQNRATENEILMNDSTFLNVYRHVQVSEPFTLEVRNRTAPLKVWPLIGVK